LITSNSQTSWLDHLFAEGKPDARVCAQETKRDSVDNLFSVTADAVAHQLH